MGSINAKTLNFPAASSLKPKRPKSCRILDGSTYLEDNFLPTSKKLIKARFPVSFRMLIKASYNSGNSFQTNKALIIPWGDPDGEPPIVEPAVVEKKGLTLRLFRAAVLSS